MDAFLIALYSTLCESQKIICIKILHNNMCLNCRIHEAIQTKKVNEMDSILLDLDHRYVCNNVYHVQMFHCRFFMLLPKRRFLGDHSLFLQESPHPL